MGWLARAVGVRDTICSSADVSEQEVATLVSWPRSSRKKLRVLVMMYG